MVLALKKKQEALSQLMIDRATIVFPIPLYAVKLADE